jgi:hypothetical protein
MRTDRLSERAVVSASLDGRSEDIRVHAVVISELELGDIERQIFFADLVESADHAALDKRPEALNRLCVDGSDHILAGMMVNRLERVFVGEAAISGPSIGAKQADLVGDGFTNECRERRALDVLDDARDDVPLAANCADDNGFAAARSVAARSVALVFVPVLGLPADKGFVDFDDTAELVDIFDQSDANAMAHIPSRLERAEAHIAPDLASAHSLFADQHQVDNAKPVAQWLVRVLKDSSRKVRETIAVWRALLALPVMTGRERINFRIAAARADDAFGPAARNQVRDAMRFVGKQMLKLGDGQLMDLLRLFLTSHDGFLLSMERT